MAAGTVTFLGAAGTVTGSKHLVRAAGRHVLLDCGLFQGRKNLRLKNWSAPPLDPAALDAVVLSHAHVDHSGYLPRLVRDGFDGPVYCTAATADLLDIMLRDAAYLEEEQAALANRHGFSKHVPALPLFTLEDAEAALRLLAPRPLHRALEVAPGIRATFRHAGHILGAATVSLELPDGATLFFSGDVGRPGQPILKDPEPPASADTVLVESTYGDRVHAPNPNEALARVVRETAERGAALIIPAFSVGRTQDLLWRLRLLEREGAIPTLPVYLDSPMAIDVTALYARHTEDHDREMTSSMQAGDPPLATAQFTIARTVEASKALNDLRGPFVLISASGMATGGRVLHHLKRRLPERSTTVLLVTFQAAGTRGRALQDGATTLRIHGTDVPVAARVETVDGLSAHADRQEIVDWLRSADRPPAIVHLVHGEPAASKALAATIRDELGWRVAPARDGATVGIGPR